ncbi:hypothetical protein FOQG_16722 [Fusarium oxysporum f. sp. raphani 54005]|uniref:Uncharacterized protein n=2 Tax=Fusarium oxysporum f. sp. raphani TaxID=96318 RepID=X0C7A1_FUSOX|nr:hypothetical protein FOQG_16722 [Fusarium oxysporum f. sp. raphani 54005]KAG7425940.1 hypothetical protein Forpi1262_v012796 [Fusarium oxysporum f. sp. raphani]
MPDHSQPPPEISSRAQLYIIVNPFTSYEQFLQLCVHFFSTHHLWSIVIEGPCLWRIYQGHLLDGDPRIEISGDRMTIERPERQLKHFEVASFPSVWLRYVEDRIDSVYPEDAQDDLECNRK